MGRARNNLIVFGLAGLVIAVVVVGMLNRPGGDAADAPEGTAERGQDGEPVAMPPSLRDGKTARAGAPAGGGGETGPGAAAARADSPDRPGGAEPTPKADLEPLPDPEPGPAGVLAGKVVAGGQPVTGATLKLWYDAEATGKAREPGVTGYHNGTTGPYGEFRFEGVAPGTWTLHVAAPGHTPARRTGIRLTSEAGLTGYVVRLRTEGDPSLGGVEGHVTGAGGIPVVGAEVVASSETGSSITAVTDQDGYYRISPLAPGSYAVRMKPPDEGEEQDRMRGQTRFVTVVEGKTVTVDFGGGGEFTGLVLDSSGDPLVGVIVRISPVKLDGNYRSQKALTGEDGRFRIANAEPTEYRVTVQSVKKGDSFVTEVGKVDLRGGFQDATFRLAASGISGKVILADTGKAPEFPAQRATLALYRLVPRKDGDGEIIDGSAGMAFVRSDGGYVFKSIAPGRYRIYAHLSGYRKAQRDLEVRAGEAKSGVNFRLEVLRPGTVIITVKDEEGALVEGATFSWNSDRDIWSSLRAEMTSPGVYVIKTLEAGPKVVSAYRSDKGAGRVTVDVKEGGTTRASTVLIPFKR